MTQSLIPLMLALLFGFAGYRQAAAYEQRSGEQAWGMPPIAWAAICSVSLLIGGVLFAVATHGKDGAPKTEWRLLRSVGAGALFVVGGSVGVVAVGVAVSEDGGGLGGLAVALVVAAVLIGLGVLVLRGGRRSGRGAPSPGRFVI